MRVLSKAMVSIVDDDMFTIFTQLLSGGHYRYVFVVYIGMFLLYISVYILLYDITEILLLRSNK